jgi:hypothetical protein
MRNRGKSNRSRRRRRSSRSRQVHALIAGPHAAGAVHPAPAGMSRPAQSLAAWIALRPMTLQLGQKARALSLQLG